MVYCTVKFLFVNKKILFDPLSLLMLFYEKKTGDGVRLLIVSGLQGLITPTL